MQSKFVTPCDSVNIAAKMPPNTRGVWLLMNDTGLRISDAIKVKHGDFDNFGYLHYKAVKTGKNGRVKVSQTFIDQYIVPDKKYKKRFVFVSPKNPQNHICRQTVYLHIKKACKLCGISDVGISPHSARKSFAVRDFREFGLGKTMHDLQHKDASTTLLYAMSDDPFPQLFERIKAIEEEQAEMLEKIDLIFDKFFPERYNIKICE